MTEMRWKRVESIFHEALSLHGEPREKFLAEACQGDDDLRSEVDSLLANYHESDEFLEQGALPGAEISQPFGPTVSSGVVLGHYEIIELLGAGGMGEVYLARDQRLGRKVALKILPAGFAGSMERLKREAQAASALNHPNILTIYDFGQQSELHYIVSEFVEGVQLRQKIGNLSRLEALNYARQIGQALEAAHSAGIVHRDIKPENIMVRPDGLIKVLDFGLAKLVSPQSESDRSLYQRLAGSGATSIPGMLIGTLNYMSPEQVKGQPADLRTDIWSWGVVLYEMLFGRRPFEAPTPQEVMASILHKELEAPGGREEANGVVLKALSKQPEGRFQSMAEALAELEPPRTPGSGRLFSDWLKSFLLEWSQRTPKKTGWIIAIGVLLIFGSGGYFLLHQSSTHQGSVEGRRDLKTNVARNPQMRVEQLTHRESVTHAALAPGEDYVVYSEQRNGREALRVHYLADGHEEEIAHTSKGSYNGITLVKSKDGDVIYYVKGQGGRSKLYQLQFSGQHRQLPLMLDDDIDSPVSFSPDGSRFVFVRFNRKTKEAALVIRTPENGLETSLPPLKPPEFMYPSPLWSTDGQFVLFDIYGNSTKIRSIDVKDAALQEKILDSFLWQGHAAWIENGQNIAVAAKHYSDNSQLFKVSWPEGIISEIHPDQLDYGDVDSRPGSKKIIAIQSDKRSTTIWTGPVAGKLKQVSDIKGKYSGIAWTPPGDLVSETDVGANGSQADLVIINPRNVEERDHYRQTYDMCEERDPVVSPDGKYLVYASTVRDEVSHRCDGVFHLWRKDLTNKDALPKRLTSSEGLEYQPVISPDSKTVLYTSVTDSEHLWKISIDGGYPTQLTKMTARKADVSPDGERIACQYLLEEGWSTAILRMSDGRRIKALPDISGGATARWSADGKHLLYVKTDKGVSNIWSQPLSGGFPTQLTQFKSEQIFAFALSPDRRSLACLHGTKSSDVVLLQPAE